MVVIMFLDLKQDEECEGGSCCDYCWFDYRLNQLVCLDCLRVDDGLYGLDVFDADLELLLCLWLYWF